MAPRKGFAASDVYFRDERNGYAIGNVPCAKPPGYCATLMGTTDGGTTWTPMTVPAGLTAVDDQGNTNMRGSCGTNGGIAGPCVDRVVFGDAMHGYLFSHNFSYTTADAGRTWHNQNAMVLDLVVVQGHVVRLRATGGCSTCLARLEVAAVGANRWQDLSPGGHDLFVPHLVSGGGVAYVNAYTPAPNPTPVRYRSTDGGLTWQSVSAICTLATVAPDGTAVALCPDGSKESIRLIGTQSAAFGPTRATPALSNANPVTVARTASDVTLYQATDTSVIAYESVDGGATWTSVPNAAPWTPIDATVGYRLDGDSVTLHRTISITHDGGKTFTSHGF